MEENDPVALLDHTTPHSVDPDERFLLSALDHHQHLQARSRQGKYPYGGVHVSQTNQPIPQVRPPLTECRWESVNIAFSTISFIINLIQIAKFIAEALTPLGMLFGNIVGMVFSVAILALDIVVYTQYQEKNYSLIALALDCALLLFTTIPTIYGTIVYRRLSAYDDYHHPHNVKHFGFAEVQDTSYNPSRMSLNVDRETAYNPAGLPDTRPRRPSFTFQRTSSAGSSNNSVSPHPRPSGERRPSYDHKRDTQFDEYLAQRSSVNLKDGVEHALGAEFGWDDDRRSSIVNSGLVPASQARPRVNSLTRAASWEINLGPESPDSPAGVQRGHSLVSVPEAREEEDIGEQGARRTRPISEDKQVLLGQNDLGDGRISGYSFSSHGSPDGQLEEIPLESKKRRRGS
jgi:hypothetical protein